MKKNNLKTRKFLFIILILVGLTSVYFNLNEPISNTKPKSLQDSIKCDIFSSYNSVEETLNGEKFVSADTNQPINGVLCDNNKRYIIKMKDGYANGMTYYFNKFGELIIETPYIKGKKEGISKVYNDNKISKIIPYKNNKINGEVKEYYINGFYTQQYKDNKYNGYMILYDNNNNEWAKILYKNNKIISGKCSNGRKWSKKELMIWEKEIAPNITLSHFCKGIKKID